MTGLVPSFRSVLVCALLLVTAGFIKPALTQEPIQLRSIDGRLHDPVAGRPSSKATVLVFVSVECPISNRYAPEINRLRTAFSSQGVDFRLIYPNGYDSPEEIRAHLSAYAYPDIAFRDPDQALARHLRVRVTPEAVVVDSMGRVRYRGRIDDRFVNVGVQRSQPTRQDLADAISATLAGATVTSASTAAVGCYIFDFGR